MDPLPCAAAYQGLNLIPSQARLKCLRVSGHSTLARDIFKHRQSFAESDR